MLWQINMSTLAKHVLLLKQKLVLILVDVSQLSVCRLLENITSRPESISTPVLSLWILRIVAEKPPAGKLQGIHEKNWKILNIQWSSSVINMLFLSFIQMLHTNCPDTHLFQAAGV